MTTLFIEHVLRYPQMKSSNTTTTGAERSRILTILQGCSALQKMQYSEPISWCRLLVYRAGVIVGAIDIEAEGFTHRTRLGYT